MGDTPGRHPPRLARRLLRRLVRTSEAQEVEATLARLHAERAQRDGMGPAGRWYWRQVLGFGVRWRGMNERRGGGAVERWVRDMRLACRSLARAPGFTTLAVATLALGIGANTAIFGVIRGSLLRPLPYHDPDGLVWLSDAHPAFGGSGLNQSIPNLEDLRTDSRLMTGVAIYRTPSVNLATDLVSERVVALTTSSELLSVLGMAPSMGRDLVVGDDERDAEPVVLLSDELWRSRFGRDPSVLGTTVVVNARPTRIVGVLPAGFSFPGDPKVVLPLRHVGANPSRGSRGYFGIGRLAPGADLAALRTELAGIFDRLRVAYPHENEGFTTWADPLEAWVVRRGERPLAILAGAVALVLLIACVNVTNLLLVRAESRRRELAVRYSLGAKRSALLSQFLGEGLVLAVAGGLLGVLAAHWGVDLLVALYGDTLPRAGEVRVDGLVWAFAGITTLVVGVVVGIVPALRTSPDELHEVLKDGSRGSSGRTGRLGRILIVTEVALAVLVVTGAGLLTHSMWRLQQVPLGVTDTERVMTFRMSLPGSAYTTSQALGGVLDELGRELRALPGVEAVGFVNRLPLLGGDNTTVGAYGDDSRTADFVSARTITSGYFESIGAPLLAGRWLDDVELRDGAETTVVNETLARQLFGDEDPLGRRLATGYVEDGLLIVGVSGDIVGGNPDRPAPPAFYLPLSTMLRVWGPPPPDDQLWISVLVKTVGDPRPLVPSLRRAVAAVDPQLPIDRTATLHDLAVERLGSRRFAMSLFGVFAALALLLGAVGIYGVMSYSVSQRSPELGLRMALGAERRTVLRMVLAQGVRLTAPGIALGLLASLGAARILRGLLYDVSPVDPWTYGTVALILSGIAVTATWAPALRATRVDPSANLRRE